MRATWWGGVGLALAAACLPAPKPPEPLKPVRFLLINDVYVADTLDDGSGGLARVATVRHRLADQGPILFVLAGDVLSPSLLSKYYGGRQMVEALNAAKLDYATFGNHEFELPRDTLIARIDGLDRSSGSRPTAPSPTAPGFRRSCPGTRFASPVIWSASSASPSRAPTGATCGAPIRTAPRLAVADTLTALKADLIVGLTHQTIEADRESARPRAARSI